LRFYCRFAAILRLSRFRCIFKCPAIVVIRGDI
jgi:hypothetical protein